jgi:hypothetical protein
MSDSKSYSAAAISECAPSNRRSLKIIFKLQITGGACAESGKAVKIIFLKFIYSRRNYEGLEIRGFSKTACMSFVCHPVKQLRRSII